MKNLQQNVTRALLTASLAVVPIWAQAQEKKERRVIRVEKHDGGEHEIRFLRPTPTKNRTFVTRVAGEAGENKTWLGVHIGEVSNVTAAQLGLKTGTGLVVEHVVEESPADKAGLKQYDILVEFGDQLLVNAAQLQVLVAAAEPDETVELALIRGGKRKTIEAELKERKIKSVRLEASKLLGGVPRKQGSEEHIVHSWTHDDDLASEAIGELIWKGNVRDDLEPFHTRTIELGNAITVLKDDTGTYHLRNQDGKRHLRFENEDGKVVFEGLFEGDDTEGLPKEVIGKLKAIHSPEEIGVRHLRRIFKGKESDAPGEGANSVEIEIDTDDRPAERPVQERSL